MPTLNTRLQRASEYPLIIYNGEAIINRAFRFYTVIDCIDLPYEEIDFDFPDYVSSYFRIFNERSGRLIVEVALDRDNAYLIVNASVSDMTFDDEGNYYYEIGYVRAVYEQALRYGPVKVI